jgi:hypothetical protein
MGSFKPARAEERLRAFALKPNEKILFNKERDSPTGLTGHTGCSAFGGCDDRSAIAYVALSA